MLCPEGVQFQNDILAKEEEDISSKKSKKQPTEGSGMELNSYKSPKSWKKSLTSFFRNQLRSSKSNDGDRPPGSKERFQEKEINPEQKWQSLGKVFKRQSFVEHWQKPFNQQGESSSQNKRLAVRKVISGYFGKGKSQLQSQPDKNQN